MLADNQTRSKAGYEGGSLGRSRNPEPVSALTAEGRDLLPGSEACHEGTPVDVEESMVLAVLETMISEGAEIAVDGQRRRGHGFVSVKGEGFVAAPALPLPP